MADYGAEEFDCLLGSYYVSNIMTACESGLRQQEPTLILCKQNHSR